MFFLANLLNLITQAVPALLMLLGCTWGLSPLSRTGPSQLEDMRWSWKERLLGMMAIVALSLVLLLQILIDTFNVWSAPHLLLLPLLFVNSFYLGRAIANLWLTRRASRSKLFRAQASAP